MHAVGGTERGFRLGPTQHAAQVEAVNSGMENIAAPRLGGVVEPLEVELREAIRLDPDYANAPLFLGILAGHLHVTAERDPRESPPELVEQELEGVDPRIRGVQQRASIADRAQPEAIDGRALGLEGLAREFRVVLGAHVDHRLVVAFLILVGLAEAAEQGIADLALAADELELALALGDADEADELNLIGLAKTANDLADRARIKKLKPEEATGVSGAEASGSAVFVSSGAGLSVNTSAT